MSTKKAKAPIIESLLIAALFLCGCASAYSQNADEQVRTAKEASDKASKEKGNAPTTLALMNGVLVEVPLSGSAEAAPVSGIDPLNVPAANQRQPVLTKPVAPKTAEPQSTDEPNSPTAARPTKTVTEPLSTAEPKKREIPENAQSTDEPAPAKAGDTKSPAKYVGPQSTDAQPGGSGTKKP